MAFGVALEIMVACDFCVFLCYYWPNYVQTNTSGILDGGVFKEILAFFWYECFNLKQDL